MTGKGAKGLSGKGAKGTMGDKKGDKKKPISRSARAGLQFPVGRIHRLLKVRPSTLMPSDGSGTPQCLMSYQRDPNTALTSCESCRAVSPRMGEWEPPQLCIQQPFWVRSGAVLPPRQLPRWFAEGSRSHCCDAMRHCSCEGLPTPAD